MFITKRKHEAIVDGLEQRVADMANELDAYEEATRMLVSELATLRAARAKANANLISGGKKREASGG
jgi:chaperonin cofactor prefoldin